MFGALVTVAQRLLEKDTMRALKLAAVLAIALAGCAPRYSWYNPSIDPSVAERQRDIDSAECTAVAMRSIPSPALPTPTPAPAPNNYPVSGTITLDGENGETYTGHYRANGNGAGLYESPAQAQLEAAEAWQAGEAADEAHRANQAQDRLADACMMRRGWAKVMAGQQPNLAAVSAGAVQAPPATATTPAAPPATAAIPSAASFQSFGDWQKTHGN